jgi:hypothetical protein
MTSLRSIYEDGLLSPPPRFRNVFFSFHYVDVVLAAQIRNSWVVKGSEAAGFRDWADWEQVRRRDQDSIRRWINNQLDGTSVTVVLIGQRTHERYWVNYEIEESVRRGNGVLGIHMHLMNGFDVDPKRGLLGAPQPGRSPFLRHRPRVTQGIAASAMSQPAATLNDQIDTYCWVTNRGYDYFGDWIDKAARAVDK